MPEISPRTEGRPLLKWAGGKRQLLPVLRGVYPASFGRYFEPFAGSAAVFFDLSARDRLGHGAELIDRNADLIACYQAVRDEPDAVVRELGRLAEGHARGGSAHYYDVRDAFNRLRLQRPSRNGAASARAAMFLYLNRTGYNGLYRLNASGAFNVPAGRYARPRICDPPLIHAASAVMHASSVRLRVGTFEDAAADAQADDFLYFDPPYAPLSATAAFTTYTASGFGADEQRRLRDSVVALHQRGCHVVVSNSSAPLVLDLYEEAVTQSGGRLQLWSVPARRAINSRVDRRGPVRELILTSVAPDWRQPVDAARLK
jgi:DNA adenine methylase